MIGQTQTGCSENHTGSSEFLLLGFQILPSVKTLLFLIFLTIYMLTVAGNILVMVVVSTNIHLHSPMYIFLCNLSCLEIWYTSSVVPTLLGGLLKEVFLIPLTACIVQFFFFCWLATTECFLITMMAYDRYVAICHPLHYTTIMDQHICFKLAISTWTCGLTGAVTTIFLLCQLEFPDYSEIDGFFCDVMPLTKAACSDPSVIEMEVFVISLIVLSSQFSLIILSYVHIIAAILRIPSATGRHKAFSTCGSHLAVGITYFGMLTIMYMVPTGGNALNPSKALSLLYTVGTPVFNPIVYTLRNKGIRRAVRKVFSGSWCRLPNPKGRSFWKHPKVI